jgi:RNA polymerase sigma factor (TIGR02999 family)
MAERSEITQLLRAWSAGETSAPEKLMPLVYTELRRLAKAHMARERPDHTLQSTALVHEAYLRLVDITQVRWEDRAHFFAMCAQMMRRISGGQGAGAALLKARERSPSSSIR